MSAKDSDAAFYEHELSDAERQLVSEGKLVIHTEDLDGSEWSRVTVYRWAASEPIHLLAAFANYHRHRKLFSEPGSREGIVECSLSRVIPPAACEVDYTMAFPSILGVSVEDLHFTVRSTLRFDHLRPCGVEWQLVRATRAMSDLRGELRVEAQGSGSVFSLSMGIWLNMETGTGRLLAPFQRRFIHHMRGAADRLAEVVSRATPAELATLMDEATRAHESLTTAPS